MIEGRQLVRETKHVRVTSDLVWTWMESKKEEPPYAIEGKYLYFSPYVTQLEAIAENEIVNHFFHIAKWSREPELGDHVLCLYWAADVRKIELALRAQKEYGWQCERDSRHRWETDWKKATRVRFRFWKADADTLRGVYSDKFIQGTKRPDLMPKDGHRNVDEKARTRKKRRG